MFLARSAAVLALSLLLVSGAGAATRADATPLAAPANVHAFLLRADEQSDNTFSRTPAFTFGNSARSSPDVRINSINNWDAGFFKNNRFGRDERFNVQFRAEFFNTFNRARFGYPGSQVGQANFGVVSTQINRPRQIQLALKLQF